MAGRGTDILLGGNAEALAKDALAEERAARAASATEAAQDDGEETDDDARLIVLTEQFKKQCEQERIEVLAAGGLKIIGTERHESRRIDNQLRGRAGRQGDPGTSRFYLSLQDDLLRIFGLDRMAGIMERLGLEEDVPIESPMVTRSIEGAQKKVEGRNFDQRKSVLEYDDVMNQQRKTIYSLRRQILDGRYHREPTEDEKRRGIEPEPAASSGDWTVEALAPDLAPTLGQMIEAVQARATERQQAVARGESVEDEPPWWRLLRGEIWRQFGALLDLDEHHGDDRSRLVEWTTAQVAASLIQQRERLYDLADARMGATIESVLLVDGDEERDWAGLADALQAQFQIDVEIRPGTVEEVAAQVWPLIDQRLGEREREARANMAAVFSASLRVGGDRSAVDRASEGDGRAT